MKVGDRVYAEFERKSGTVHVVDFVSTTHEHYDYGVLFDGYTRLMGANENELLPVEVKVIEGKVGYSTHGDFYTVDGKWLDVEQYLTNGDCIRITIEKLPKEAR